MADNNDEKVDVDNGCSSKIMTKLTMMMMMMMMMMTMMMMMMTMMTIMMMTLGRVERNWSLLFKVMTVESTVAFSMIMMRNTDRSFEDIQLSSLVHVVECIFVES